MIVPFGEETIYKVYIYAFMHVCMHALYEAQCLFKIRQDFTFYMCHI